MRAPNSALKPLRARAFALCQVLALGLLGLRARAVWAMAHNTYSLPFGPESAVPRSERRPFSALLREPAVTVLAASRWLSEYVETWGGGVAADVLFAADYGYFNAEASSEATGREERSTPPPSPPPPPPLPSLRASTDSGGRSSGGADNDDEFDYDLEDSGSGDSPPSAPLQPSPLLPPPPAVEPPTVLLISPCAGKGMPLLLRLAAEFPAAQFAVVPTGWTDPQVCRVCKDSTICSPCFVP